MKESTLGTKFSTAIRRDRMAASWCLAPEQLARDAGGMCVGRTFRHMAACTAYRVLEWEGRTDKDTVREWDASWTGERREPRTRMPKAFPIRAAAWPIPP